MSFTIDPPRVARPLLAAMRRGFLGRCPRCGQGHMFDGYLAVNDTCPVCGEELHHQRAQDASPYLTILVVGHAVVALLMSTEAMTDTIPLWVHLVVWPLVALLMCLALLRPIKGALVGYQWALHVHGFEGGSNPMTYPGRVAAKR